MTGYSIWTGSYTPGICVLRPPSFSGLRKMKRGVSLKESFPEDAECVMHPGYPHDLGLADCMKAGARPLVSEKCKSVIEAATPDNNIEFLQVSIVDHKNRRLKEPYWFLHPLDLCDCIDYDASKVVWNTITSNLISGCDSLILDETKIPDNFRMFRLSNWGYVIMVHPLMAETLRNANLTGLELFPAEKYTGIQ